MKKIDIFTTDKYKKMQKSSTYFEQDTETESNLIKLYPDISFQNIVGFGGAFTESAGYVYSLMSDENKTRFLKLYFSDNRYKIGRAHV